MTLELRTSAGLKMDLVLNNLQRLICYKTQQTNQNSIRRNRSMTSQILTIRWILEGVHAKNLEATMLFDFSQAFDYIHRGKMEQILLAYSPPQETVIAIMMLYKNTKVKVCSPDGDRLLWHCSRCATRRHISCIAIYHN